MALAEFATNNAINVAIGYRPFCLNSGDHPPVPLVFMHSGVVSSQIDAVQTMVNWMETALEEAQANLTIAQSQGQSHVDRSRCDEAFEVGNEMVLSTRKICVNQHFLSKLLAALDWTLPSHQGDFSSGVRIGYSPNLADPSYLSCIEPEKIPPVRGF